jgi:hypothetical protein
MRPRARWLALLLIGASPFLMSALLKAHPEEPFGAVLCLAALWAAARQHWALGAVLLGLAAGNKPWAVLAGIPMLILLERRRIWATGTAMVTAAVVYVPFLFAGSSGLRAEAGAVHAAGSFKPWQVWWFLGDAEHLHPETYGSTLRPLYRDAPAWIERLSHPLAVLVPAVVSLALAPMLRRRPRTDILLLLAIAFLLRGMLDVWNNVYYALPFVFTLTAWEVAARRAPLLSLLVTVTGWTVLAVLPIWVSPDLQAAAYLLWSLPLLLGLVTTLIWPRALRILASPRSRAGAVSGLPGRHRLALDETV